MKNKICKCIFTSIAAAAFAASVSFGATAVGFTFISPAGEWRGKELAKDEDVAAFAKTVANAREVARVLAQVSALGCFEFYVNGKLVSVSEDGMRCDFLRPGATDREKRRHYVSYDITKMWKRGAREKNTLSAFVARSWFSDMIGSRTDVKPAFGANVRVEYSDGGVETIKTDASWTASFGTPFARAGIYWGEVYDGRVSADAAECAGDSPAEKNLAFKGRVTPLEGPGVSIRWDLAMHPVEAYVYSSATGAKDGEYGRVAVDRRWDGKGPITIKRGERLVIDFGQNAAAIPEIVAKANRGATLTFKGAEMLNESNGEKKRGNDGPAGSIHRANYRILKDDGALVRYTFAGKDVERYIPTFTYMGYRYAEITATGTTELYSVKSVPVTSIRKSMERGSLRCGHRGVDKLAECAKWGEYSNFLSIPTGCSGRDERNGWTADLHVFTAAAYRFADVYSFIEKWMGDMRDAQDRKGGYPNVAPRQRGNGSGYGQCGWSDAGVIVPYISWRMTGDKAIIGQNFDSMARFVAMQQKTKYKTDVAPRAHFQFADWLSYEKYETFFRRNRDRDGNVLPEAKVWWDFLAGCYWLSNARMMSEMAAAIGKDEERSAYDAMASEAEAYIKGEYMKDGRLPVFLRDMQTPHLFALHLGLYADPAVKAESVAQLVANIESHGNRLQTGFLGTSILMDTLTYDAGRPDVAYSILLQRGDPSWLQMVDNGATTIWERWDSYTKEKGFGNARMNSFNHYAYGAVADWLYGTAAGIRPGKDGGFDKEFVLAPIPDARLGSIRAEYKTKSGTIISEWKCENGRCRWHFEVPEGSVATVTFNGRTDRYAAGKHYLDMEP